jgi:hypothetical protein
MQDVFNAIPPNIMAMGTHLPLLDRAPNGDLASGEADGTSFSAPVTAAVALLMSQAAGRPLDTEQFKKIMADTAYQLNDGVDGAGALDAVKAVQAAQRLGVNQDFNKLLERLGVIMDTEKLPQKFYRAFQN